MWGTSLVVTDLLLSQHRPPPHPPLPPLPPSGFHLKDAGAAFVVADVRQSHAAVSADRTKLLDRIGGLDGRGLRDLNTQVGGKGGEEV